MRHRRCSSHLPQCLPTPRTAAHPARRWADIGLTTRLAVRASEDREWQKSRVAAKRSNQRRIVHGKSGRPAFGGTHTHKFQGRLLDLIFLDTVVCACLWDRPCDVCKVGVHHPTHESQEFDELHPIRTSFLGDVCNFRIQHGPVVRLDFHTQATKQSDQGRGRQSFALGLSRRLLYLALAAEPTVALIPTQKHLLELGDLALAETHLPGDTSNFVHFQAIISLVQRP
mmetsp:Transcript_83780/g.164069  ORF Transcript_83780/g.164069 Transcript_83780/m.164069 type:complete len:227 (-) Transcript_83780:195-875(-)